MTTDLSGDFELGEDEFDWDVFLPDPDESEIAAEAAALEDEAELDLDDSDFDWELGLREDAESDSDADTGARAGAAYDRIVDTVRRSTEDEPGDDALSEPVAVLGPEASVAAESEPGAVPVAAAFEVAWDADTDKGPAVHDVPAAGLDAEGDPVPALTFDADRTWETEPDREPAALFMGDPDPAADLTSEPPVMPEFEPDFEEPAIAPFAAAATGAGLLGGMDAPPLPPEAEPSRPMAPAGSWEADDPAEPEPEPRLLDAGPEDDGEGEATGRSRVFTATVVLACLFLLVIAAAVAVRALHHSATTPPAVHSAPPASTSPGTASSATTSSGTARIQAATDAVDSATTAASVGLTSLTAFPTPTNVETVINPYISSLQLFQTFLSGAKVPAPAQAAATSVEAQLHEDLQFLDTIDGLAPQQLGAYLVQFDTDATRLQTTLSTLEQNLRTPAS